MSFLRVLAWVPLVILLFSCVKADPASRGQPGPAGAAQAGDSPALELAAELAAGQALGGPGFPPEALLALLRPAASPLWFEVSTSPEAPRHIPSPAESELVPFTPWPLAPHVAATLVAGGALYLAVNRDSLLVIVPMEGGNLGLYRFAATAYWESYTVGNLFLYEDAPALFFYRDDNFAEPAAPPPRPPVLALAPPEAALGPGTAATGSAALIPLAIPALAGPAAGWELDILRQGRDGLWYYRELRRVDGGREFRYFRSPTLSRPGEEVAVQTYRDAQAPAEPVAGTADAGQGDALPPLPETFVYTHVNRLGDLVVAAWEEQEDYSIGAAGFMVIRSP